MFPRLQLSSRSFLLAAAIAAQAAPNDPASPSGDFGRLMSQAKQYLVREEFARQSLLEALEFGRVGAGTCVSRPSLPPGTLNPDRSLFVHDRATLTGADFTFAAVLNQLARQASSRDPSATGISLLRQLLKTQTERTASDPAYEPHCDDNGGTLNGFPNPCRRLEAAFLSANDRELETQMRLWEPLALVNRLDLAHAGWRNCGEFRAIFGLLPAGAFRRFIIFEGVLPNPKPGCAAKCQEVADFWARLSRMEEPSDRAAALHEFFFDGIPGFRPVIHVDHYSATGVSGYGGSGSGQIRMNLFMEDPWDLREFKTALDCGSTPCHFQIVPIPIRDSPPALLWNETVSNTPGPLQATARHFQTQVLNQVSSLARPYLNEISWVLPPSTHDSHHKHSLIFGETRLESFLSQFESAPTGTMEFPFRRELETRAAAVGLTAAQVVKRAQSQSCGGCHSPQRFELENMGTLIRPDGTSVTAWPETDFTHVVGGPSRPSPALTEVFLPQRMRFLEDFLQAPSCPCAERFVGVPSMLQAMQLEDSISRVFDSKREALQKQIEERLAQKFIDPLVDPVLLAVGQSLRDLENEAFLKTRWELKARGIEVPNPEMSLEPIPLITQYPKGMDEKAKGHAQWLVEKVWLESNREPHRRTVTGAMPIH
jgi:hypothetical protein